MKQLKNRIQRIEENSESQSGNQANIWNFSDPISKKEKEEVERLVKEPFEKPREPLFAVTPNGYINVFEIKDSDLLDRICDDYAQMRIELYSKEELQELGISEAGHKKEVENETS